MTTLHDASMVDCTILVDRFFQRLPPFSRDKPSEFRDAIAALSLQAYAEANQICIHVIAEDKDWKSICEDDRFSNLLWVGHLGKAITSLERLYKAEKATELEEEELFATLDEYMSYYSTVDDAIDAGIYRTDFYFAEDAQSERTRIEMQITDVVDFF